MCIDPRCPQDTAAHIASSKVGLYRESGLHTEISSDSCSGTALDPLLVNLTEAESSTHPQQGKNATSSGSENEGICSKKKDLRRPEVVKLVRSLGALNLLEGNIPGDSHHADHNLGPVGSHNFHSKGLLHIEFHESVDQMVEGA